MIQNKTYLRVYAAGAVSLATFFMMQLLPPSGTARKKVMLEASETMAEATETIRRCRAESGVAVDGKNDPNETSLIGEDFTPLTTSLGNLGAKRTTTNPDFAALIVFLLDRAGAKRGDIIAVGASSSFPALIVATLSAARAMGLEPLLIYSLGASQWGANNPRFHWLDMELCLRRAGIITFKPVAVTLGGDEDTGRDMDPELRALLLKGIAESGFRLLEVPGLEENVRARTRLYEERAQGRPIKAFINIGGNGANIGADESILKLEPGLARDIFVPPAGKRGVIQEMSRLGIPVIHLLNIKGLAGRYGLPWDPKPLPRPGKGGLNRLASMSPLFFAPIAGVYFLIALMLLIIKKPFSIESRSRLDS